MGGKTYPILCFVRVALVFLPQIGYIHPDEHMQGPEVVYGDILQLSTNRPWEFEGKRPIRNIVFPYLVTGIPALGARLAGILNLRGGHWFSYLLLIMPRIVMCCLSFLIDFFLFKICQLQEKDSKLCLSLFASSYVTLVYLPRTFSNSIEAILFSCLIFILSNILYLNSNATSFLFLHTVHTSFLLGTIVGLGVFNRPTFIFFAVFPVIVFLIVISKMKHNIGNHFLSFILGGLSILLAFTFLDTFYYQRKDYLNTNTKVLFSTISQGIQGKFQAGSGHHILLLFLVVILLLFFLSSIIQCLKIALTNFYFFNFFHTNFVIGALVAYGILIRPEFLCFAILPLLLAWNTKNVIKNLVAFMLGAFCLFLAYSNCLIFNSSFHSSTLTKFVNDFTGFINSTIVSTPLNFILYNANKDNLQKHGLHPRWLHIFINIPLLFSIHGIMLIMNTFSNIRNLSVWNFKNFLLLSFFIPLILLSFIPHQEPRFLIPLIFPFILLHDSSVRYNSLCIKLWYLSNILCVLFYGYVHQSGVYLSSSNLQAELSLEYNHKYLVVFYKTYQVPKYLLGLHESQQNVHVLDLKGVPLQEFEYYLNYTTSNLGPSFSYIVTPYQLSESVLQLDVIQRQYKVHEKIELFPHLSTECLPSWSKIIKLIRSNSSILEKLRSIKSMLSIHVYFFKAVV